MARLEAKAKAGFFPTPDEVLPLICSHIRPLKEGNRILDPCCGDGRALHFLASHLKGIPYGIELDLERGKAAAERIGKGNVLIGDAFTASLSYSFTLLYLNPPYDWVKKVNPEGEEISTRLEYLFVREFTPRLFPGGLLVLVVPHYSFLHLKGELAKYIARQYEDVEVFRLPDEVEEKLKFKQVVLFGKRRLLRKTSPDPEVLKRLLEVGEDLQKAEVIGTSEKVWELREQPPVSRWTFKLNEVKPEILQFYAKESPLYGELFSKAVEKRKRPIMPLRTGHLAMLMAGGYLDGRVQKEGYNYVVRGKTVKTTVTMEEVEEKARVVREVERIDVSIEVLDLNRGEIFEIR